MIDLHLVFRFVKGRCHNNQITLEESNERGLIPLAFFALAFENELEYNYICMYALTAAMMRLHVI